jgi:hypothetical protein
MLQLHTAQCGNMSIGRNFNSDTMLAADDRFPNKIWKSSAITCTQWEHNIHEEFSREINTEKLKLWLLEECNKLEATYALTIGYHNRLIFSIIWNVI